LDGHHQAWSSDPSVAAGSECISSAEAAQLTDIPVHVIEWWKRQGRIEHRPEDRRRPTPALEQFGR